MKHDDIVFWIAIAWFVAMCAAAAWVLFSTASAFVIRNSNIGQATKDMQGPKAIPASGPTAGRNFPAPGAIHPRGPFFLERAIRFNTTFGGIPVSYRLSPQKPSSTKILQP